MDSFSFITGLSTGLIIGYFYAFIMGYAKLKKIENVVDFLMQESQNRREELLEEKK